MLDKPSEEDIIDKMDKKDAIENIDELRNIFYDLGVHKHYLNIAKKYLEILKEISQVFKVDLNGEVNILMDKAIISEDLEMMELALQYGADISMTFGIDAEESFIKKAIKYKKNPKMVMLMLTYDDIDRENYEEIQNLLNKRERWAEPFEFDKIDKIERIIKKYNPRYD